MEKTVLAASSAYNEKYYFNETFASLPPFVKDELRIMATLFCDNCGGVFKISFTVEGAVVLESEKLETDHSFDDIGAKLYLDRLKAEKKELLNQLSMYYIAFMTPEGRRLIKELGDSHNASGH